MKTKDPFSGLSAFITAAQNESFTVAGRQLSQSPSSISKAISRLEAELGIKLFHRSPRKVTLTTQGQEYYFHCKDLLSIAENARAVVTGQALEGSGLLRVALPVSFGQVVVAPALPSWQAGHPGIKLEIELMDRNVDIVQERFDLAFRFGMVPDARVIAKKLPTPRFLTVASQAYIDKHGLPKNPEQLTQHNCLGYVDPQTKQVRTWTFEKDATTNHFNPNGGLIADQGALLLEVAKQGGGILHAPDYLIANELDSKQLVQLFPRIDSYGPEWHLIYPQQRQPSLKLHAFVDFIEGLLQQTTNR